MDTGNWGTTEKKKGWRSEIKKNVQSALMKSPIFEQSGAFET